MDQLAEGRTEKPWLLIYDNADGPALLRKLTPADNAHVLITTRRTDWHDEADEELAVDVFDRATAIAYLLKHARNGDADAAGRLADALHRLPLALSHARAYCWSRNWGFDQYIARLPELIAEAPKDAAYPASVFATFSLAIERAAAECAEAETLMALLAFFAPDKIPLWLIPEDVLSEKQRDDALAALNAVSLAAYDNLADGKPAVSVHRLVQEVMRGRLRGVARFEETAAQAIRFFLALTIGTAPRSRPCTAARHGCLTRWPPWITLPAKAGSPAKQSGSAISSAIFASDAANSLAQWTPMSVAKKLRKLLPAPSQTTPDGSAICRCRMRRWAMCSWPRATLADALKAYRDSLAIRERLAKADPGNAGWQRDLSVSYERVGDVLVAQGALADALKAYRDSLAIRERLAKADPGNAGWQVDVAFAYWRLAANGDKPAENWRKIIDILQRLDGEGRLAPVHKKWLEQAKEKLTALRKIMRPLDFGHPVDGQIAISSGWPPRRAAMTTELRVLG